MHKINKYCVFKIGGKQQLGTEGQIIETELISGKKGEKITVSEVMLIKAEKLLLGKPLLKNAKVQGEIVEQLRGEKIRVAKYRAKSRYRKVKGHRQYKTKIKILKIVS